MIQWDQRRQEVQQLLVCVVIGSCTIENIYVRPACQALAVLCTWHIVFWHICIYDKQVWH